MRHTGRVSGERFNRLVENMVQHFWDRVRYFEELLLEDGYPPFHEPLSPQQQYDLLLAWREAGDPRYWNDSEAQTALAELELQFGRAPVRPAEPLI